MPTFNYKCKNCEFEKSELVFKYDDVVKCDKCENDMERLFSPSSSIKFGGGGWTPKSNRDSTGNLRDQTAMTKQDLKDIANKDLYKNTPAPINVKD